MAIDCGNIKQNIGFDCDNPIQGGVGNRAWIINKKDIVSVVYNVVNKMIIETIALRVGSTAFFIDGYQNSIQPYTELVKGTFVETHLHRVGFRLFDLSPEQKENLTGMLNGQYVIIVELNYKGTDGASAFEVYGIDKGLNQVTTLTKDPNEQDGQGSINLIIEGHEPKIPKNFFNVSYAVTLALIESLLVGVDVLQFSNGDAVQFSNGDFVEYN